MKILFGDELLLLTVVRIRTMGVPKVSFKLNSRKTKEREKLNLQSGKAELAVAIGVLNAIFGLHFMKTVIMATELEKIKLVDFRSLGLYLDHSYTGP